MVGVPRREKRASERPDVSEAARWVWFGFAEDVSGVIKRLRAGGRAGGRAGVVLVVVERGEGGCVREEKVVEVWRCQWRRLCVFPRVSRPQTLPLALPRPHDWTYARSRPPARPPSRKDRLCFTCSCGKSPLLPAVPIALRRLITQADFPFFSFVPSDLLFCHSCSLCRTNSCTEQQPASGRQNDSATSMAEAAAAGDTAGAASALHTPGLEESCPRSPGPGRAGSSPAATSVVFVL